MISNDPWLWLYSLIIVAILAGIYKDNVLLKALERVVIGGATAHAVLMAFKNINNQGITRISEGHITFVLPILFGLMLFTRYSKEYRWVARLPNAILLGIGTGLSLRLIPKAEIFAQINSTILPIFSVGPMQALTNLLVIILVIGGVYNFIFNTKLDNKYTRPLRRIGRTGIIAAMGPLYVSQQISYMSRLIGVIQDLIINWLGLV